LTYGAAPE